MEYREYFSSLKPDKRKSRPAKRVKKQCVEKPVKHDRETVMLDASGIALLREHFKAFKPASVSKIKVNHDPYGRYARQDAPRTTEDMKPAELDTWQRFLANLAVVRR